MARRIGWLGAVAVAAAGLALLPALAQEKGGNPGAARRAVKNGTDPDSGRVNPQPVRTTVEKLLETPRPLDLGVSEPNPEYENRRAAPAETTVWEIEATVVSHQLMPDGDYRVVLKGESGKTLVVELPDPKAAGANSRWAKELADSRKLFKDKLDPQTKAQEANLRIRLAGIGHFGRPNSKFDPMNSSGIRLQPALKVEWLPEKPQRK